MYDIQKDVKNVVEKAVNKYGSMEKAIFEIRTRRTRQQHGDTEAVFRSWCPHNKAQFELNIQAQQAKHIRTQLNTQT